MITNPSAIRMFCSGDSNTHGMSSTPGELVRHADDVRWTGRIQVLLGDAYEGSGLSTGNVPLFTRAGFTAHRELTVGRRLVMRKALSA